MKTRFLTLILLGAVWATPASHAREGVEVGSASGLRKLVPAEGLENSAAQQYKQMLQSAAQQRALGPDNHPQVIRLRAIAQKLIPHALPWNERAAKWTWEVNLIGSKQINAFCMPGGKIAFYSGILDQLKLTDDEVAMIMGHEIAHALREHARERMAKSTGTDILLRGGAAILGLGQLGDMAASGASSLLKLKYGRDDETESDLVGMELAARAGYDPRSGVILWQKMGMASKGSPPQWLSTHPKGTNRIQDIEKNLPKVMPLFAKSRGVNEKQLAPYKSNIEELTRAAPASSAPGAGFAPSAPSQSNQPR
jgi:predicted Zn-dependent protease